MPDMTLLEYYRKTGITWIQLKIFEALLDAPLREQVANELVASKPIQYLERYCELDEFLRTIMGISAELTPRDEKPARLFKSRRIQVNEPFKQIKKDYFPKWDITNQWRIRSAPSLLSDGRCNTDLRIIQIGLLKGGVELKKTIIHEICHAITGSDHGKKWVMRMIKCNQTAKDLDDAELSIELSREVKRYKNVYKKKAQDIYSVVKDIVFDAPNISLKELKIVFERRYGSFNNDQHKRLRAAFKRAKWLYKKSMRASPEFDRLRTDIQRYLSNGMPEVAFNLLKLYRKDLTNKINSVIKNKKLLDDFEGINKLDVQLDEHRLECERLKYLWSKKIEKVTNRLMAIIVKVKKTRKK